MLGIDRRSVQNFDWTLLFLIGLLTLAGMVNLASATAGGEVMSSEFRRQLFSLGLGASVAIAFATIDYRHFERLALPAFAVAAGALVLTLVIAEVTRGSQSWLFGGRVQPSELAKVALVLALARYFQRYPPGQTTRLRDLLWPAAIIAVPVGLIVAQRDMGVALLTLLIGSTYLFLVKIPWRAWLGVGALAIAALAALWSFGLADYQKERILGVVDPGRDRLGSGYQVSQSRIAIGSGGLFGAGYQEGTQTQLRFLPTQHTDFAFSVLAEEWGFLGSCLTLGLYLSLLIWGLVVARNSKDDFGSLLAIGVVGCLFWPAALNVAMVLGLAPVIGVPLPLFSYGGSALVVTFALLGLLMNVSMRRYVF
ncbi:MAG: rod shape-determining protein RodA [Myxococcota bacterium]